ncbi:unnamed protein product [Hymenolepis diminuta]|uniref:Uncharacterized protein n=1 Tax=Hymenolepis diminuta TaxID=6216 RepID=A0A564Y059_HYMDI|nr:unnamed protein product [Hymenolepis diminuta]
MDSTDVIYEKTISKLSLIVGDNSSLFGRCYKYFNVVTHEFEDVRHYLILFISKKTHSDVPISFFVPDLLTMLRFDSDFCPREQGV